MKKLITTSVLLAILATCTTILAQERPEEYLGLPGDNLNLYAVMKLFQESETLEGFERSLNDKNSNINNLDLNGDNYVDYIKVLDYTDRDVHTIVLQVALDPRENQDVAVFTVQRFREGQVQIQLIGDESLYGRDYIIEPIFDDAIAGQTPNPGYLGNNGRIYDRNVTVIRTTPVMIASWPLIRFIYAPSYIAWRSSWYWGYRPAYWHPWRPHYWHYYYGYHYNWYNDYYRYYRRSNHHRYTRWNDFYYNGRRSHSSYVSVRIKSGKYKTTYSHPQQRRKGEAMYTKLHQGKNTGGTNISSGNSRVRRSATPTGDNRSSGTSVTTTRRTTTTVNNRTVTNRAGQNTGTVRRSNSTVTRSQSTPSSSRGKAVSSGNSGKSTQKVVNPSNRRSSTSKKSVTTSNNSEKQKNTKTKDTRRR